MSLVKYAAALLLEEENLNGETLLSALDQLMEYPAKRAEMSERAKTLGEPHATDKLIQVMMDEVKNKNESI